MERFRFFSFHSLWAHRQERFIGMYLHNIIIVTLLSSRVWWKYADGDVTIIFFQLQ